MRRHDLISPVLTRYLPNDPALMEFILNQGNLVGLLRDIVLPRIRNLERGLQSFAEEHTGEQVPVRIDGRCVGWTTVGNVFREYAVRLSHRKLDLEQRTAFPGDDTAFLSDVMYFSVSTWSVLANIADDTRHQFRSEIDAFTQGDYGGARIGSSTMPHKRNPIEYENVKSMWKAYVPRVTTVIMGQITEHQGDSTNDLLLPIVYETACMLAYSTEKLRTSIEGLIFLGGKA